MIRSLVAVLTAVPLVLGLTGLPAAGRPGDPVRGCADLARTHIPGTTVTSAATVTNERGQEYCQVRGVIRPQTRFAVRLPTAGWTGQYVQLGCGGLCGVVPELDLPLFGFRCPAALAGTLVLAADDTGHTGDPAGSEPATWGRDPRLRLEFGLLSEHKLRWVAERVTKAYYGRGPSYRYFDGCSTGGRQALNLAQRFPTDFDGILAGAPSNNLAPLSLLNAWLAVKNTDRSGRQILGPDKLPALHAAVIRECGEVIEDPRRCGFQPSSLACPPGTDGASCLTPAQVAAVTAFYRGPTDPHGRHLYNGGVPYGSELAWRDQFVVTSGSPQNGRAGRIALNYLRYLAFPHNPPADFTLDDVRFTTATFHRLNLLGEAIYNANDPDLSAFRAAGGKIILFHGWADAFIPPFSTTDYYAAVQRRGGSQAFSRLYMIPAGYHCLFGPEPDGNPSEIGLPEFLTPLIDWVERGTAPATINVPTITPAGEVIRSLDVAPFDALAPVHAAPDSLNAPYRYVGHYR
jgi:feruloyl esterase